MNFSLRTALLLCVFRAVGLRIASVPTAHPQSKTQLASAVFSEARFSTTGTELRAGIAEIA
ncbi:MAG: hypothetical protein E5V79_00735 [Mesorhizobium sp.]|uniref:hypothetical protein n=1 Tax=unclassified Mesorhizobium TaxID=325217 RepID=UPI000F760AC6|nr:MULTISPECIES: hypothetical protein [unclassified Mesorhizobium]AZO18062.1 hypothetical protein EJ069_27275 [Mesorhizobium sp. M2A.F.Ca.ET.043.05.1.1]RVB71692.1 hypothetical protein EN885_31535 [Mesorhizobium sp. M6A.T.Cr.TU.014.01.1.1]RWP96046.1 MAG: hypothetical protein EOR90_30595 [Mesorhizobium sp.]RWP96985.1 MAG: hypothetical protein EOR91_30455 [Mesorhizobium sp.]TIV75673.1 MAG: hypothetical protein E5V79_00735 [Mesorhizobium sp.]